MILADFFHKMKNVCIFASSNSGTIAIGTITGGTTNVLILKGTIAQLVEQRTENPCVPGSIPGGTTSDPC